MSTIIFGGNTYTFGATVSTNPGTGTTSYVFGGLNAGSTYGFIIWAFNGFGPSSIVGPISKTTVVNFEEIRPQIDIFSWDFVGQSDLKYTYYGVNELNSENLIVPSEGWQNVLSSFSRSGFTFPQGYTTDPFGTQRAITARAIAGSFSFFSLVVFDGPNIQIDPGQTYYFSYYHNIQGGTGNQINIVGYSAANATGNDPTRIFYSYDQIAPVTATNTTSYPGISGNSAWQRFIYRFVGSTTHYYIQPFLTWKGFGATTDLLFFGAQLDTGSGGTAKTYKPNWLTGENVESGSSYTSRFFGYGTTMYDASPTTIANWPIANGLTYFWPQPQSQAIPLSPGLVNSGFREYDTFKNIAILAALPENKRAFRPRYFDDNHPFYDYQDSISGSATGYYNLYGKISTYFGENGNSYIGITSLTAYINNVWPVIGISSYSKTLETFMSLFSACGATVAYHFWDNESVPIGYGCFETPGGNGNPAFGWSGADLLIQDSRFYQPWNGVTSLAELVDAAGISPWNRPGSNDQYTWVGYSWYRIMSYYQSKAFELSRNPVYNKYAPNIVASNYGHYYSDDKIRDAIIGNASSPVLYGDSIDKRNKYVQRYYPTKLDDPVTYGLDGVKSIILESLDLFNWSTVTGVTGTFGTTEVIDPRGLNRSVKMNELSTNSIHGFDLYNTVSTPYGIYNQNMNLGPTGTPYVFSIYVKSPASGGITYLHTSVVAGGGGIGAIFDIKNGTIGSCAVASVSTGYSWYTGISNVGNSWYRCWISATTHNPSALAYIKVRSSNTKNVSNFDSNISFTGNTSNNLYLWGAQLDVNSGTAPSELYERGPGIIGASLGDGWLSFISCLKIAKSCKRGSYNTPLTPWISNVGYYGEYGATIPTRFNLTKERPNIGFCSVVKGYNPQYGMTFTQEGGNSAYYYEFIKHLMMYGVKAMPLFSLNLFADVRLDAYNPEKLVPTGSTSYINEIRLLCETVHEVHQKIGGFTLTTGDITDVAWDAPYLVSGAPAPNGNTWWWRVTTRLGNTISVNGYTLPDINGNIGTWVSTTGPTLGYVPITVL